MCESDFQKLTSQVCFAFVAVSLRRNSDIISCVSVCVNTFLRFFIFVFLPRKTFLPSHWISYQLFQTVEFDYSTCPKFLSTNIYMKYRLFLQVRAKNLEAPTLALPGLLVAKRRKRDLNPRAAWTPYTLSRGASSASWVFLHNLNCFPLPIFYCASLRRKSYYT